MRFDNNTNQIKPRLRFFHISISIFQQFQIQRKTSYTTQEESKKKVIKCKCFFLLSSCLYSNLSNEKVFFSFNFFDLVIFLRRIEIQFSFLLALFVWWEEALKCLFVMCCTQFIYFLSEGSNLLYL